jgi:glycosyltransferase involved in cell wall biosynthesis
MNKKVLIITYYWPPSGGAGVQRWLKFAKYLPEFGWEPIVLTVNPDSASYPQKDYTLLKEIKDIKLYTTKTFELYNLYTVFKKDKQIPYGGFSNEGSPSVFNKISRFIRGNFFIPDPRKGWNRFAYKKAGEILMKNDISVIITTGPPHSTHLIGKKLKQKYNLKWLVDLRDPWTDIYYYNKFYPTVIAKRIDANYEKQVVIKSDLLLTVSNSLRLKILEKYNFSDLKVKVITNGYDLCDFEKTEKTKIRRNEILYTGTITNEYPLDDIIHLCEKLDGYKFRFIGNVTKVLLDKINKMDLNDRFEFNETVPHDVVIKEMISAEFLLLLIPKIKDSLGILTGKLFEYIGAGRPIIAIGPQGGDVQDIIDDLDNGIYIPFDGVTDIVIQDIKKYKEKEININSEKYTRRMLTKKLSIILNGL